MPLFNKALLGRKPYICLPRWLSDVRKYMYVLLRHFRYGYDVVVLCGRYRHKTEAAIAPAKAVQRRW